MPGNLGLARGAKFHHRCSFVRSMRRLDVLVVASPKLWLAKLQRAANTRYHSQSPARRKGFWRPEQGPSDHLTAQCAPPEPSATVDPATPDRGAQCRAPFLLQERLSTYSCPQRSSIRFQV